MTSSRARVLIVDDNAETVAVLRDILSKEGYEISSAAIPTRRTDIWKGPRRI